MAIPPNFLCFSTEHQNQIKQFYRATSSKVMINKFGIVIKGSDIHCLRIPTSNIKSVSYQLNDQIINQYFNMICQRSNEMTKGNVHMFALDTHLFPTFRIAYNRLSSLLGENVDLFTFDMVLVPIHQADHWCLAIIWPKKREIKLFNSYDLGKDFAESIFSHLLVLLYLHSGGTVHTNSWTRHDASDQIPQQQNGYDCGVFTCIYAEYASRGQFNFDFTQAHMSYFRQKILYEICTGQLLDNRYRIVGKSATLFKNKKKIDFTSSYQKK